MTLARSSTAKAACGFACRSRHFFDLLSPWPPISMVCASASRRNPTGTMWGEPPLSTVASRPSRWPCRYSISFSVNGLMVTSLLMPHTLSQMIELDQLSYSVNG